MKWMGILVVGLVGCVLPADSNDIGSDAEELVSKACFARTSKPLFGSSSQQTECRDCMTCRQMVYGAYPVQNFCNLYEADSAYKLKFCGEDYCFDQCGTWLNWQVSYREDNFGDFCMNCLTHQCEPMVNACLHQ